jgi:hypothetical protein
MVRICAEHGSAYVGRPAKYNSLTANTWGVLHPCSHVVNHPAPAGSNTGGFMRYLMSAAIALSLSGCVHSSGTMLDNRTAIISARGSAFNNDAQVVQGVLREAAQLTQQRGYSHFLVTDSEDRTTAGTINAPGTATTTGTLTGYGNTATYNGYTTYSPGQSFNVIRPGMDVMIVMFHASDAPQGAWLAAEVLATQARR